MYWGLGNLCREKTPSFYQVISNSLFYLLLAEKQHGCHFLALSLLRMSLSHGSFPKIRHPFLRVPMTRTIVFGGHIKDFLIMETPRSIHVSHNLNS